MDRFEEQNSGTDSMSIYKHYEKVQKSIQKQEKLINKYDRELHGEGLGNISLTVDKIDESFRERTGLSKSEIGLVFLATALQCTRIIILNNLTKIEKAGSGNKKEDAIHRGQKKILEKLDNDSEEPSKLYYASMQQIVFGRGVPYDATSYAAEKLGRFKGANHRFSTLGHDPAVGLIFGTANILTNTITCINKPIITTDHVFYDSNNKNPRIGGQLASTTVMLNKSFIRLKEEREAVIAACIKQLCHIATDLYTPCGIQLPMMNLVLDKGSVEKITRVVSTGDVLKSGVSMGINEFINIVISVIHAVICQERKDKLFEVRNRKIIDYSNMIATGSNIICVAVEEVIGCSTGDISKCAKAAKSLDVAGIIKTVNRLVQDEKFIYDVKREFYITNFQKSMWRS